MIEPATSRKTLTLSLAGISIAGIFAVTLVSIIIYSNNLQGGFEAASWANKEEAQQDHQQDQTTQAIAVHTKLSKGQEAFQLLDKPRLDSATPIITSPVQEKIKRDPKKTIAVVVNTKDKQKIRAKGLGVIKDESKESMLVELPAEQVEALVHETGQTLVEENKQYRLMLTESGPLVGAPAVWQQGLTGAGVTIAIIDTGIDVNHEAFPPGKILSYVDFTVPTGGQSNLSDMGGHGTHVAGIAAGNSSTIKGIAPGAHLLIAKVFRINSEGDIVTESMIVRKAIEWAQDAGADIISMSLGSPPPSDQGLEAAIKNAKDAGIILVASAGNCGPGPCNSCRTWGYTGITYPAGFPSVIAVGATTKQDTLACYSSQGPINGLIKPDVSAPGDYINAPKAGGGYVTKPGTSMAAPHIAGALAVLKQAYPSLNADLAMEVLAMTSKDLGAPGKDNQFGVGRLDMKSFAIINISDISPVEVFYARQLTSGVPQHIEVHIGKRRNTTLTATITKPGSSTPAILALQAENHTVEAYTVYAADYLDTNQTGLYTLNVTIPIGGYAQVLTRTFEVIPGAGNFIRNFTIPSFAGISSGFEAQAFLQSPSLINATLEIQLLQNASIIFSASKTISLSGETMERIRLQANATPQAYTARMIVSSGMQSSTAERPITLRDDIPPVVPFGLETIEAIQGLPAIINIPVIDHSRLHGNATIIDPAGTPSIIPLLQPSSETTGGVASGGAASGAVVSGALLNTTIAGEYHYIATICDAAGNCIQEGPWNMTVRACQDEKILIISDGHSNSLTSTFSQLLGRNATLSHQPTQQSSQQRQPFCAGDLPRQSITELPRQYLSGFKGLFWESGQGRTSIEPQDFDTISWLFHNNHTIVLTGGGIAERYRGSEALDKILRMQHLKQYSLAFANHSTLKVFPNRKHPLAGPLDPWIEVYPSSAAKPAALTASGGSEAVARYEDGGTAIDGGAAMIVYESTSDQYLERLAITSFSLDNINTTHQYPLAYALATWATENPAEDFTFINASTDRYPVDGRPFTLIFSTNLNEDSLPEQGVAFLELRAITAPKTITERTWPDGPLLSNLSAPVRRGKAEFQLNPPPNSEQIGRQIAYSAELTTPHAEKNYLNNRIAGMLSIAPLLPDLEVDIAGTAWKEGIINLTVTIANKGGTSADAKATITVGGQERQVQHALDPGSSATDSLILFSSNRSENVKVIADPDNAVLESNESNNIIETTIYSCLKESIAIINDTAGNSTPEDSMSAAMISRALTTANYCVDLLSPDQVRRNSSILQEYAVIVWSSGTKADIGLTPPIMEDHARTPFLLEGEHIGSADPRVLYKTGILYASEQSIIEGSPIITRNSKLLPTNASLHASKGLADIFYGDPVADYNETGTAVAISEPDIFISEPATVTDQDSASDPGAPSEPDATGTTVTPLARHAVIGFSASSIREGGVRDALIQNLITFLIGNHRPTLRVTAPGTVREGDTVVIEVNATDQDQDNLTVSINVTPMISNSTITNSTPPNASINHSETVPPLLERNGSQYLWRTGFLDAGVYTIIVTASDRTSAVSRTFNLTIFNTNRPPVLFSNQTSITIPAGETAMLGFTAFDPDGDNMVLSATEPSARIIPLNGSFNESVNENHSEQAFRPYLLVWNPTGKQAGDYLINVSARDHENQATLSFHFTITPLTTPEPRLIVTIPSRVEAEAGTEVILSGSVFSSEIAQGRDPSLLHININDSRFIPLSRLNPRRPACALVLGTICFSYQWQTSQPDIGDYDVQVTVSYGQSSASAHTRIVITAPPPPPVRETPALHISPIALRNAIEGKELSMRLNASYRYMLRGPPGITLLESTLRWNPAPWQLGTHEVWLNATDGQAVGNISFFITVYPTPGPGINPENNHTVGAGSSSSTSLRLPKNARVLDAVWSITNEAPKDATPFIERTFQGKTNVTASEGQSAVSIRVPKRAKILDSTFMISVLQAPEQILRLLSTFTYFQTNATAVAINQSAMIHLRLPKSSMVIDANFSMNTFAFCSVYTPLGCPASPTCPPWYFHSACTSITNITNFTYAQFLHAQVLRASSNTTSIKLPKLANVAGSYLQLMKGDNP